MKFSGQFSDGTIDNLLRAYVSRPSNPHQPCPDFDPDQANAYVERSLKDASLMRYEAHLAGCAGCRKSVVALAQMARVDSLGSATPAREVYQATWLSRVKQALGALSQPQWAMAATAVIVLAVSLPLFLSRNQTQDLSRSVSEQPTDVFTPSAPAGAGPATRLSDAPALPAASPKQRENAADDKDEAAVKNVPATSAGTAAGFASDSESSKKGDVKSQTESAEVAQRKTESKTESQVATAPAQSAAAPVSQVARTDADQARQQQTEKDATTQQANEGKLAARAEQKQTVDRVEEAAPPAPRSSSDESRNRSGLRRPGRLALRDSSAEAVRPEERRFSGKKFLFRDGAWTDKDFDPNKDLPVVTIIRDSNVYNEVLNKRPGLKPFLTGFATTERAVIVYKGTVYKLIPQ